MENVISVKTLRKQIYKEKSLFTSTRIIDLDTSEAQEMLAFRIGDIATKLNEIYRNSKSVRSVPSSESEGSIDGRTSVNIVRQQATKAIFDFVSVIRKFHDEANEMLDDLGGFELNQLYSCPRKIKVVFHVPTTSNFLNAVKDLDDLVKKLDKLVIAGELEDIDKVTKVKAIHTSLTKLLETLQVVSSRLLNERRIIRKKRRENDLKKGERQRINRKRKRKLAEKLATEARENNNRTAPKNKVKVSKVVQQTVAEKKPNPPRRKSTKPKKVSGTNQENKNIQTDDAVGVAE